MKKLADFIYRRSKLIILFVIVLNILSLVSFIRFSLDTDFLSFFSAGNPEAQEYDRLNEKYNTSEAITVLIETQGSLLEKDSLLSVYHLQEQLTKIDGVERVQSYIPPEIQFQGTIIPVDEALISANYTQLAVFIENSYFMTDQLLSPDNDSSIMVVTLQKDANPADIITAIKTAGENAGNLSISPVGDAVIQDTLQRYLLRVLIILPPCAIILVLLVFYIVLRNRRFTVFAIIPAGLAALWTFGTIFWSGQQLNLVTVLCPIFIIVMGSAYGLHFISHFQDSLTHSGDRRELLKETYDRVGMPILLAVITTMAGFVSLTLADVLPMRHMGIFVTLGIAYAGFLALFFLPALLSRVKLPQHAERGGGSRLVHLVTAIYQKKIAVILVFLVIIAISGFYITRIQVVSDTLMFFKQSSEIRQTFDKVEQEFGGALPLIGEIAIEGGKESLYDYEHAQKVLNTERELEQLSGIKSVFSIYDLIAGINKMMTGQPGYPQNPVIAQTIVAQLDSESLSTWISEDGIRLTIKTLDLSAQDIEALEAYVSAHNGNIQTITGMPLLFDEMNRMVVRSQVRSLGLALVLVFLMLLIMLKNVKAALAGLIPIIITITAIMGMISLTGFNLNILTANLAAIAVGVGVDYSVHIISGIHYYRRQEHDNRVAIKSALTTVTRPVLANAFGLSIGMSVLFFSPLYLHLQAASVMWVAMVVSSLAALLLIPIIYSVRQHKENI